MSILVLLTALTFVVIVTPMVRQFAIRINFVATPRADRAHQNTTPLMGGVALYIGLMLAILLFTISLAVASDILNFDDVTWSINEVYITLGMSILMGLVGLLDDRYRFPPFLKAGLQLVVILILLETTEISVRMPTVNTFNYYLTVCWILYVMNAFNYLDNMDGTAATVASVAAIFFAVIATINGQILVAALASAIAGISLGFLRYNLFAEEQKIFMGDAGSLFLGYWLAILGMKLTFPVESPLITWPVPVLVLGIPLFDTSMVFVSRLRRGERFLTGGVDHLAHRLDRLDYGRYGVPFLLGFVNMLLGSVALLVMHSSITTSLIVQGVVIVIGLYAFYHLEYKASHEFITGKSPDADALE